MFLCKYNKIFGNSGEGAHSYRVLNIAIVDVLATIIVAFIIHKLTGYKFIYVALFLFGLGIILHRIFCVRTTIDKLLFADSVSDKKTNISETEWE
jgi:hypothetical protein